MKFSGVMMNSDNAAALGDFYTKLLGEPTFTEGGWYGWGGSNQLIIGSHSDVHDKNDMPARIMLTLEVENVKMAFDTAIAAGAGVVAEPYQPNPEDEMLLATVSDLDGNYLQLARPWAE